jgi:hypothetical protein
MPVHTHHHHHHHEGQAMNHMIDVSRNLLFWVSADDAESGKGSNVSLSTVAELVIVAAEPTYELDEASKEMDRVAKFETIRFFVSRRSLSELIEFLVKLDNEMDVLDEAVAQKLAGTTEAGPGQETPAPQPLG